MSATRITELPAATSLGANDLIIVVSDPSSLPATRKIDQAGFYSNVTVNVKFGNVVTFAANTTSNAYTTVNNFVITNRSTPSSSADPAVNGKMWFDTNYLYLAVANNTIKRISLSAF